MISTKDIDNKVFGYLYTLGETLSSIAWKIRAYYHRTIQATPRQDDFVRDMILNLASVIDWLVTIPGKQQQVDIDNVQGNAR